MSDNKVDPPFNAMPYCKPVEKAKEDKTEGKTPLEIALRGVTESLTKYDGVSATTAQGATFLEKEKLRVAVREVLEEMGYFFPYWYAPYDHRYIPPYFPPYNPWALPQTWCKVGTPAY